MVSPCLVDEGRLTELVWSELDADDVTEFEYNCVYSLLDTLDARTLLAAVGQRALVSLTRKSGRPANRSRNTSTGTRPRHRQGADRQHARSYPLIEHAS
ncbi:hypothetical protein DMH04_53215 [Kibdelosporangium aridum]|uniref:Uncharacterized protein n=1 Tax=Kibdelosporangium aridum TaxID=2030 RepID=A0A428Y355_KIBAR|nr:hypothetical protein DMH04_53215 [Kibdelosporangium aridum]